MRPEDGETPGGSGDRTPLSVEVRWARLGDVPGMVRMYRGQSGSSRWFHHPYPFDRPRLTLLFLYIVLAQHAARWLIRNLPNWAFVFLVATMPSDSELLGYASIRFVRRRVEPVWGRFGFLVAEGCRGRGVGTALAIAMYETCLGLGVERGGGTIQRDNVVSRSVVERYGYRMVPAGEVDRFAPEQPNLEGVEDLHGVLEKVRAHQASKSGVGTPTR